MSCSKCVDDAKKTLEQALTDAIEIHFNAGMEVERERIIKLLEENFCDCDSDNCKGWFLPDAETLIALIKGENNG